MRLNELRCGHKAHWCGQALSPIEQAALTHAAIHECHIM